MAKSKSVKCKIKAVLRTNLADKCIFCNSLVDDELVYGNFYSLQDISCHYFCVLLSSFAMQHGNDEQGLFGFLYSDIKEEAERGMKYKCSYCHKFGATLGCSVSQCRKQFHLPCGRQRNAVSIFNGNYKSFCELHVPKQHIPDKIMEIAKTRKSLANKRKRLNCENEEQEIICVICCEPVPGYPSPESFWPPCCAKDVWFHRLCIQRASLSAGIHYLKCPLCNDKEMFYKAAVSQGIYVPDRDASWELEQNAFNDMYERPDKCIAEDCICPMGRDHTTDDGEWEVVVCLLCGAGGSHAGCARGSRFVCAGCQDMAGHNLQQLAEKLEAVRVKEAATRQRRRGPTMPSRMSLRRSKPLSLPSTSSASESSSSSARYLKPEELLENKVKPIKMVPQKVFSPIKLLDERIQSKLTSLDMAETEVLVARMREKFIRPMPLTEKRKIVTSIIEELLSEVMPSITAEHIRDQFSPVKNHYHNVELNKKRIPKFSLDNVSVTNEEAKLEKEITTNKNSFEKNMATEIILKENKELDTTVNNNNEPKSDTLNKSNNENKKLKMNDIEHNSSMGISEAKKSFKTNLPNEIIVKEDKGQDTTFNNNDEPKSDDINKSTNENNQFKTIDIEKNPNMEIAKNINSSERNMPTEIIVKDDINYNNVPKCNDSINKFNNENNKLKTIDIENNSSMEISASDEAVRVDVIQLDESTDGSSMKDLLLQTIPDKCSLKFGALDKELLDNKNNDIDLESFKNQYLTEVDKNIFKCNFNHKHDDNKLNFKMNSVINFAINAAIQRDSNEESANITDEEKICRKRKLAADENVPKKKYKSKHKKKSKLLKIRLKTKKKKHLKKEKQKNKTENPKTPVKVNESPKTFKQTVLNFSPESEIKSPIKTPNCQLIKSPIKTPNKLIKRKSIKHNTKDDNFKQTSLFNFFLLKQE